MNFKLLILMSFFSAVVNAQSNSVDHLNNLANFASINDLCSSTYKSLGEAKKSAGYTKFNVGLYAGVSEFPEYDQKYFFSVVESEIENLKMLTIPELIQECEAFSEALSHVRDDGLLKSPRK